MAHQGPVRGGMVPMQEKSLLRRTVIRVMGVGIFHIPRIRPIRAIASPGLLGGRDLHRQHGSC